MKNRCVVLLFVAVLLSGCATTPGTPTGDTGSAAPAPASAASVPVRSSRHIELKNGTVLVGTVEKEEAGKLHIQAELLGSIVIDASLAGPPAAPPDAQRLIILKNKTRLVGTIQKEEGGKLYINADLLGLIAIDAANVARRGK